jgi:hypothetical protein
MKILQLAACAALLTSMLTVTAVPSTAQSVAGACYETGHVPALSSKTRVFSTAVLEVETVGPDGRHSVSTVARRSIVVAKAPISGTSELTLIPADKGTTVRVKPMLCAYPADAVLPAEFANRAPDIVMP